MRDAGFSKEQAATRLGHGDDGELLDCVYRGNRVRRAGRRSTRSGAYERRSTRPGRDAEGALENTPSPEWLREAALCRNFME